MENVAKIYDVIIEAHHLVYIVGWSIYQKVNLVREPTRRPTLGSTFKM